MCVCVFVEGVGAFFREWNVNIGCKACDVLKVGIDMF